MLANRISTEQLVSEEGVDKEAFENSKINNMLATHDSVI